MIRVRFAPSPTGNLHIGGARTALFNWLYARSRKGEFVLRIEDTDAKRSRQEYVDEILYSLGWLGFNWDKIYYQSQRLEVYLDSARRLLKQGLAYTEKSADGNGEAIIFKVRPQEVVVNDLIRGRISFDSENIKDQVLIKSDGTPTYNFACVVDDAEMGISHIIRGDDHISNTPKQVLLYQSLGLRLPEFAHLPLIMGSDGRLSKRTGATAISDYRKLGYLAEALVNYLLLLSWSPGDNREVIDIKEAAKIFDIKQVNKTAAAFDLNKLSWMNNQYIKSYDTQKLADLLVPELAERGLIDGNNFDRNYLNSLVKLFQDRMNTLLEFAERADFFFCEDPAMDQKAKEKYLSRDLSREFRMFSQRLSSLPVFDTASIEISFRQMVAELGIESKALIHPVRVALTGKTVGPGLFDVIYHLGLDRTKERLAKFIKE